MVVLKPSKIKSLLYNKRMRFNVSYRYFFEVRGGLLRQVTYTDQRPVLYSLESWTCHLCTGTQELQKHREGPSFCLTIKLWYGWLGFVDESVTSSHQFSYPGLGVKTIYSQRNQDQFRKVERLGVRILYLYYFWNLWFILSQMTQRLCLGPYVIHHPLTIKSVSKEDNRKTLSQGKNSGSDVTSSH